MIDGPGREDQVAVVCPVAVVQGPEVLDALQEAGVGPPEEPGETLRAPRRGVHRYGRGRVSPPYARPYTADSGSARCGVQMRDPHGGEARRISVPLQLGEGPGPRVHPHLGTPAAQQAAGAGAVGPWVRGGRPEDGEGLAGRLRAASPYAPPVLSGHTER